MGRTIPTAIQMLHQEVDSWKPFRAILSKSERKQFDKMEGAHTSTTMQ